MPNNRDTKQYTVQSVAKALRLVDIAAEAPLEGFSLTEIVRAAGISKSAGFGLIRTLVDAGYLRAFGPGPRYSLGMAFLRLGDRASQQLPISQVTAPILSELRRTTGLTARVAIVDHGYPIFVDRVDGVGAVRFHAPLGVRELPHATAAGKAILASFSREDVARIAAETGLPRQTPRTICDLPTLEQELTIIRHRGYAVDNEEAVEGVFCISAAFFDHTAHCAGAVSVTGLKPDIPDSRLEELGNSVRASADQVSQVLRGTSPLTAAK